MKDQRERCEFVIERRSYTHNLSSFEIKSLKKNSGLNRIRTHELCNTGVVLYQLSYKAIWELVTLWVRNISVEGEECKRIYEKSPIWTAEKDKNLWLIVAVIHNLSICGEIKAWKKFFSGFNNCDDQS